MHKNRGEEGRFYAEAEFLFQQLLHNVFFLDAFGLGLVIPHDTMTKDGGGDSLYILDIG
jgi:hypothetical protein